MGKGLIIRGVGKGLIIGGVGKGLIIVGSGGEGFNYRGERGIETFMFLFFPLFEIPTGT